MKKLFFAKLTLVILSNCYISSTIYSQCLNPATSMTGNPSANWDDCGNATEMYAFETSYGGSNGANGVAEIDALNYVCQTYSGMVVGQIYRLSFNYSKRTNCGLAGGIQLDITNPNGATSNITVNNNTWAWSSYSQTFTATATSGQIILNVPAAYTSSCGVVVDNVCLTLISALSIDLISFDVQKDKSRDRGNINWETSTETTAKLFTVEKSLDLTNWYSFATRKREEFTSTIGNYNVIDDQPSEGINYYRLQMENNDGEVTYSDVKSITFGDVESVSTYPNPTNGLIHLEGPMDIDKLLVYDVSGKQVDVLPIQVGDDHWILNLEDFEKGTYFVACQGAMYYEIHRIIYSN